MLPPPLLLLLLLLIKLRVAIVAKVLSELLLLELELLLLGANALAKAKVARVLLPLEPLDPDPESPPLTAKSVAAGELPKELITTASVVDIFLLLSIATAASGLI